MEQKPVCPYISGVRCDVKNCVYNQKIIAPQMKFMSHRNTPVALQILFVPHLKHNLINMIRRLPTHLQTAGNFKF